MNENLLVVAITVVFALLMVVGFVGLHSAGVRVQANRQAEQERLIAEEKEREEQERLAAEQRAREEQRQREEQERQRLAAEQREREEQERQRIAAEQLAEEERRLAEQKEREKREWELEQERANQRRATALDLYEELRKNNFNIWSMPAIAAEKTFFRDYNYSVSRRGGTTFELSIDTGIRHSNSIGSVSFPMQDVRKTSDNRVWYHSIRFSVSGDADAISELAGNSNKYLARVYFANLHFFTNDPPRADVQEIVIVEASKEQLAKVVAERAAEQAGMEAVRAAERAERRAAADADWRTQINQINEWQEYNQRQQQRQRERDFWLSR